MWDTVCAACLADRGHTVVGIDKAAAKVDLIRSGRSPVVEREIDELVERTVEIWASDGDRGRDRGGQKHRPVPRMRGHAQPPKRGAWPRRHRGGIHGNRTGASVEADPP